MARKKLLSEGEIRQFMKLALLRPASGDRLQELSPYPGARGEEEEEEEEEPGEEVEFEDVEDVEDIEDEDVPEMADEPLEGEEKMVSMDDFMQILDRAVEEVTGEEADVSYEPEPEIEPEPEGLEEPEEGALPQLEEPPPGARDMYENQDQVVAEVARRVTARLQRETKKEEIADQLAERIMKRLTK